MTTLPVPTMRGYRPSDPIDSLPPVAANILRAAMRIIERDGFKALTYEAIGAESGEYKDSIRYYFGGKEGLIQAVFDATSHDESLRIYAEGRQHPPGAARIRSTIMASRTLPESSGNRVMWELLPHVLRNEHLRHRVADLYELYRAHYLEVFEANGDPARQAVVRRYATLLLAVLDGLAMQKAIDPERVDLDELFDLWADVVADSADRHLAGKTSGGGADAADAAGGPAEAAPPGATA
jgi:AcrR family transcriptional regulator